MDQFITKVLQNKKISPDYYELSFTWPRNLAPKAGHFLTIRTLLNDDPILRRPFAFSAFDKQNSTASLIYQLRGKGTKAMTTLVPGEDLDVLGPLGGCFSDCDSHHPIILGGGIGTGPMVYLANQWAAQGKSPQLILGYRSKQWIPQVELHDNVDLIITTDDGSQGFHGHGISYLQSLAAVKDPLYACGPQVMLKACHELSEKYQVPCYVSMEELMACGVGACQGCAIEVNLPQKYLRVCKEGPVFESRILKWN